MGSLPTLTLVLSALGAALSAVVLFIHHRIATSQGAYTSFCDVSANLSCDAVLGSSFASFAGIPVAGWALASYAAVAVLTLMLLRGPAERRPLVATALVALTLGMLGISAYFFFVSVFALRVACPLCLSLDAVNVALFATTAVLARSFTSTVPARTAASAAAASGTSMRTALLGAGAATVLAVAVLGFVQTQGDALSGPITVAHAREADPRFYAWYISQPVVEMPFRDAESARASGALSVIEFSDFECPHCRRAFLDLSSAIAQGESGVRVVHRHFPLNADCNPGAKSRVHANACAAAVAAECADTLGQGEAYQRLLFTNQEALDPPNLLEYASKVGIDRAAFEACQKSPEAAKTVADDVSAGVAAGVESTPTLFIAGRRIKGGLQNSAQYRYALAIERERLARAGSNPPGAATGSAATP